MTFIVPCESIDVFFSLIPAVFRRQKEHKLAVLKRHGLSACEDTVFLRKAEEREAPANYVLLLQEPGEETIVVLIQWFVIADEEVISFLRILPDKYNYKESS